MGPPAARGRAGGRAPPGLPLGHGAPSWRGRRRATGPPRRRGWACRGWCGPWRSSGGPRSTCATHPIRGWCSRWRSSAWPGRSSTTRRRRSGTAWPGWSGPWPGSGTGRVVPWRTRRRRRRRPPRHRPTPGPGRRSGRSAGGGKPGPPGRPTRRAAGSGRRPGSGRLPGTGGCPGTAGCRRLRPPPPVEAPAAPGGPAPPTPRAAAGAPDRDSLVEAWGDHVLRGLPARAKALFSAGRFVAVEDGTAVFALPNAAHRDQCERGAAGGGGGAGRPLRRPVRLRLEVEGGPPPGGGPRRRPRPPATTATRTRRWTSTCHVPAGRTPTAARRRRPGCSRRSPVPRR